MLPSKYSTGSTTRHGTSKSGNRPPQQPPPLGITGVVCSSHSIEIPHRGRLSYTVYRPRMLVHNPPKQAIPGLRQPPIPLVCVAGGPGLSSQYLSVLVHHITDRAVILFDALGCGQSVANPATAPLSLEHAAQDLVLLLRKLFASSPFHLLGHSSGGIVAYEALRQIATNPTTAPLRCASLVLSNTPCNVPEALDRRQSFCADWVEGTNDADEDTTSAEAHFRTHECRRTPVPLLLQQSLMQLQQRKNKYANDWETYVASPLSHPEATEATTSGVATDVSSSSPFFPPTHILSGQYDYVTDCDDWKKLLVHAKVVQSIRLAGTSHFSMLEDETLYGSVVGSFLREWDDPSLVVSLSVRSEGR